MCTGVHEYLAAVSMDLALSYREELMELPWRGWTLPDRLPVAHVGSSAEREPGLAMGWSQARAAVARRSGP